MTALYCEIDPFAAAWLRELIAGGHIAPGIVVEDSLEDLRPHDLLPFTQVHLCAGIGVWSLALRRIGWPNDRRIWSASFPCQPFSAAGKGDGFADERHLWPSGFHLIQQCRPAVIVGEQVASKDGLAWLDLIQADMEAADYAFGAVDLCAAGVGAPHIRQRLWWVGKRLADTPGGGRQHEPHQRGQCPEIRGEPAVTKEQVQQSCTNRAGVGHLEHTQSDGRQQWWPEPSGRVGTVRPAAETGEFGGLADDDRNRRKEGIGVRPFCPEHDFEHGGTAGTGRPRPTNGHWGNADWLHCRDGKWRAVEPGTFPLAHGAPARVGRLRGYGNAIVAQAAEEFLRAALT